ARQVGDTGSIAELALPPHPHRCATGPPGPRGDHRADHADAGRESEAILRDRGPPAGCGVSRTALAAGDPWCDARRMAQPKSWQGRGGWQAGLLLRRTGVGLAGWNERVQRADVADEPALRAWLREQGVTGHAQMLLVMERFGYPDFLLATAHELIAG